MYILFAFVQLLGENKRRESAGEEPLEMPPQFNFIFRKIKYQNYLDQVEVQKRARERNKQLPALYKDPSAPQLASPPQAPKVHENVATSHGSISTKLINNINNDTLALRSAHVLAPPAHLKPSHPQFVANALHASARTSAQIAHVATPRTKASASAAPAPVASASAVAAATSAPSVPSVPCEPAVAAPAHEEEQQESASDETAAQAEQSVGTEIEVIEAKEAIEANVANAASVAETLEVTESSQANESKPYEANLTKTLKKARSARSMKYLHLGTIKEENDEDSTSEDMDCKQLEQVASLASLSSISSLASVSCGAAAHTKLNKAAPVFVQTRSFESVAVVSDEEARKEEGSEGSEEDLDKAGSAPVAAIISITSSDVVCGDTKVATEAQKKEQKQQNVSNVQNEEKVQSGGKAAQDVITRNETRLDQSAKKRVLLSPLMQVAVNKGSLKDLREQQKKKPSLVRSKSLDCLDESLGNKVALQVQQAQDQQSQLLGPEKNDVTEMTKNMFDTQTQGMQAEQQQQQQQAQAFGNNFGSYLGPPMVPGMNDFAMGSMNQSQVRNSSALGDMQQILNNLPYPPSQFEDPSFQVLVCVCVCLCGVCVYFLFVFMFMFMFV